MKLNSNGADWTEVLALTGDSSTDYDDGGAMRRVHERKREVCLCVWLGIKTEIAGVGLYSFFVWDLKRERKILRCPRLFFLSSLSLCVIWRELTRRGECWSDPFHSQSISHVIVTWVLVFWENGKNYSLNSTNKFTPTWYPFSSYIDSSKNILILDIVINTHSWSLFLSLFNTLGRER